MDLAALFAAYGAAILGSCLGIAGGVIGTWASIRNTRTPAERRFLIRCSLAVWAGVILFMLALYLVPQPYSYLLWPLYIVALLGGIRWINLRQAKLREAGGA
jgi:zinc transporter ZupT